MEPWYKVTQPREELRQGRSLDPSEFAVHLDQIASGTAPEDYKQPDKFFHRTFFSKALVDHCAMVLRRLSGETANTAPVLSLITQFGGGKTHTLATLYHLAKSGPAARNFEGVANLLKVTGLAEVPRAKVAVFVGNAWDAREGRETPWLDLAWQLAEDAGRRLLGEAARTSAPGTAILQQLFSLVNEPILILFDETLNYIGRYPHQADQFHSFVQNLTSALAGAPKAVGLLSLPASPTEMTQPLYEWQIKLTKVVGRIGLPLIATDPEEISEIIRRRLFEDIGRKTMQQAVARQYAKWVFTRRDRLPNEFADFPEEVIRKRFEACYPFHPGTLTVFQRKWQTLPTFQQTRGTLAMLGQWISQAFRSGYQSAWREPLITLGSAPLEDRDFRAKILEQLGETRLGAAIEYDIAGENAHALALDKEMKNGLGKSWLHQRVATALFFESCGGMATDKAASLPDLRFALGDPETETPLIDTAVQALAGRCYYLREIGAVGWRFGYTPNLRKIHSERKASLKQDDIDRQMQAVVQQIFREKAEITLTLFPKESSAVADRPVLSLVVLAPDEDFSPALMETLTTWTRTCGQSPRLYPGGIFWVVPESGFRLLEAVADLMAWNTINRDLQAGLLGELEPQDLTMVPTELRKAKDVVEEKIWSLYNRLLLWNGKEGVLKTMPLGQMHPSEARNITGAILARIRQEGLLNKEVGTSYIERNWPPALKEKGTWPLGGLREAFFQGHLTRLEKVDEVLRQMILRAVMRGDFGLGVGKETETLDRLWIKGDIDPEEIAFNYETFLLLPWRAEAEKKKRAGEGTKPESPEAPSGEDQQPVSVDGSGPAGATTPRMAPEPRIQELGWQGTMPKEKWNLFGIKVLTRFGASENLEIEVKVRSKTQDISLKQQLNNALRDLGLDGDFKEKL
jgi:hypothetical protein